MPTSKEIITVPRFFKPLPHQVEAWKRRASGQYKYYFVVWARQVGKDSNDIQYCLKRAWDNSGTQSVYIGLDNGWIRENIFKKYIDGRTHWMDYPEDLIEVKDTDRRVTMLNSTDGKAEATIKFIGFLNDQALIGSSYDFFQVSELSLYPQKAFRYIEPIWDNKVAKGVPFEACFNSTPRGTHNLLYDMLKKYTGESEPEAFPGAHGNVYVDVKPVTDVVNHDGSPWFEEAHLEEIKGRYMSEFGNLNMFNQEYMVDFLTVNAGLVYQGIEQLQRDGRYTDYNINPSYPVYVAWDISSKGKLTDKTAMVAFQYYNGRVFLADWYEEGGKSLVECISEVSQRNWWKYVKLGILPWDSERSASSETPIEEAKAQWPNINWHALSVERVDRGIAAVRKQIPNMIIAKNENEYGEDRLMSAFNNYEYKYLSALDNWAAKPLHNWASHLMDAVRYAIMGINEIEYFQMQPNGEPQRMPATYDAGVEPLASEEFQGPIWAKPSKLAPRKREENKEVEVIW